MVIKMKIYHGSKNIIKKPIFGYGNQYNDYGLGFYCTENFELAGEWASVYENKNGYVNQYELDITKYKLLDLCDEKYSILNWLAILLKHRSFVINNPIAKLAKEFLINNYYINVDSYDIIIGYRADDSYFSFAKDFINNTISLKQLTYAFSLGDLGKQIVLKSENVINNIEYLAYEEIDSKIYYIKRKERDINARIKYREKCKNIFYENDIYIIDLIRGEKND